ncbi:MAG: methyltransferase domain-containing protein [Actinomycetota bacterium]|nr:methyltransferase domain-containing protein [Actinomycetota bacterium]
MDRPPDRPLERRAAARTAVVWEAVHQLLASTPNSTVVDIGGGTGGIAVRVAELGHRVSVIDPSPDALAALDRRGHECGVADRLTGQQGDLADLLDLVAPGSADLVLCHGVLGIVEDPVAGLTTISRVLAPDGTLSLLVGQRHAAVLARAMAGHFDQARALLDAQQGLPERRFTATELTTLLEQTGFTTDRIHAIRVFADLVPSALLDLEPGAAAALLDLERAVADRPEYFSLAAQLHVLAGCS